MISDVLSDAAAEIQRYLREMPEVYAEYLPDIEGTLAVMDRLRQRLDAFPVDTEAV